MRRVLATLALVVTLFAQALAQSPAHQEILGFELGQRAPALAEARSLQDFLGKEIARDMTSFMAVEQPNPRYQIELKENRRLTLWFDTSKEERPIYWIEMVQSYDPPPVPQDVYERLTRDLDGPPDFEIAGPTGAPLGVLLIRIDPTLPPDQITAIKQHINAVVAKRPKEPGAQDDPFIEPGGTLQSWLDILGDKFRGKLVGIYTVSSRIDGAVTVLIDTAVAQRAQLETLE